MLKKKNKKRNTTIDRIVFYVMAIPAITIILLISAIVRPKWAIKQWWELVK